MVRTRGSGGAPIKLYVWSEPKVVTQYILPVPPATIPPLPGVNYGQLPPGAFRPPKRRKQEEVVFAPKSYLLPSTVLLF